MDRYPVNAVAAKYDASAALTDPVPNAPPAGGKGSPVRVPPRALDEAPLKRGFVI